MFVRSARSEQLNLKNVMEEFGDLPAEHSAACQLLSELTLDTCFFEQSDTGSGFVVLCLTPAHLHNVFALETMRFSK